MTITSLKELYLDQLEDLCSANQQAVEVTGELARAATDPELKNALEAGIEGIKKGSESIRLIIEEHRADSAGVHCNAMEGLVKEARHHVLETDFENDALRDAMIITQYQRMCHYAIAGYGCVAAFAKRLKLSDDAVRLNECLEHCYSGDEHMSAIAAGGVNAQAAE